MEYTISTMLNGQKDTDSNGVYSKYNNINRQAKVSGSTNPRAVAMTRPT